MGKNYFTEKERKKLEENPFVEKMKEKSEVLVMQGFYLAQIQITKIGNS